MARQDATAPSSPSPPLRWLLGAWLLLAVLASVVLPAPQAPPPLRLTLVMGPAFVFALLLKLSPAVFRQVETLNPRGLVGLHAIRFVIGVAFLGLARAGQLPLEFARAAGIGDMLAGGGALILVFAWRWVAIRGRIVLLLWNVLGVLDFFNVQRVVFGLRGRENEFSAMKHLPMALVPYVVVPLLLAIHFFFLAKLWRPSGDPAAAASKR